MTSKANFFADLHSKIRGHEADVTALFQQLDDTALSWWPEPEEWSILICFDHLNQTYAYYQAKFGRVLALRAGIEGEVDTYQPSFWGSIYMYFALNPRWSFPTPDVLQPNASPDRSSLDTYLSKQRELIDLIETLEQVDLNRTHIPIEKFVSFNLGDCLKILIYHDQLHIRQAHQVLAQYQKQAQTH